MNLFILDEMDQLSSQNEQVSMVPLQQIACRNFHVRRKYMYAESSQGLSLLHKIHSEKSGWNSA